MPDQKFVFNDEQQTAISAMKDWAKSDTEPFFVLKGSAGTGKTSCIRGLSDQLRGRLVFTAPTNKATKVLKQTLTLPDFKPEARTIYSLLGLQLKADGEVKELSTPEDPVDLTRFRAVIVDEGSMLNSQVMKYIGEAAETFTVKFLFLGDWAQLPPVGEKASPIWKLDVPGAELTTVVRHDNEILSLATSLRGMVDHPAPRFRPIMNHREDEGVWAFPTGVQLYSAIREAADRGDFSQPDKAKAIAWRNATVGKMNALIRGRIFPGAQEPWLVGDRVIFTQPANDLQDEPMAKTDDEGEITRVTVDWHPHYADLKVHNLHITLDDNTPVIARVLHLDTLKQFDDRVSRLKAEAQYQPRKWKEFWQFFDAFHKVRYAYAITAHRSQGSTYSDAYVDYKDILTNYTRHEAMRCLYVACTRPRTRLFLG